MRPDALPVCPFARVLVVSLGLAGCDARSPGPSEDEWGRVTHWEMVSAAQTFEQCTDAADWRSGFGDPESLVGTFLSYRVADDGQTATALVCATTNPDTCMPVDPPRVYAITENSLVAEGAPFSAPVEGIRCEQSSATTWTLIDQGEELSVTVETRYALTGTATACDELDEIFVEIGSDANTFGISGCVVRLEALAEYRGTR